MQFTVTINCDNAAFEDNSITSEVAVILSRLAATLEDNNDKPVEDLHGPLRDTNGNTVGSWSFVA